jgi:hypothetical protein
MREERPPTSRPEERRLEREACETIAKQPENGFFLQVQLLPNGIQEDTVEQGVLIERLPCASLP